MKRGILIFALVLVMFAQIATSQAQILNATDSLTGSANVSTFNQKTNQVLEKEINIPDNLQFVAKILFGISADEKISFQLFIILIAAWIFIYLWLVSIVKIIPFFGGAKSWFGALIVMLLMGISNGLQVLASFLIWLSSFFGILKGWEIVGLAVSLVVLAAIYFLLSRLSKYIKNKMGIEQNEIIGRNINFASEMGKVEREELR